MQLRFYRSGILSFRPTANQNRKTGPNCMPQFVELM